MYVARVSFNYSVTINFRNYSYYWVILELSSLIPCSKTWRKFCWKERQDIHIIYHIFTFILLENFYNIQNLKNFFRVWSFSFYIKKIYEYIDYFSVFLNYSLTHDNFLNPTLLISINILLYKWLKNRLGSSSIFVFTTDPFL